MDGFNQYNNDIGEMYNNSGYYNQDGQYINQGMPMNQGMPPMKKGKFKKYKKRSGCLVRLIKFILIVVFIVFMFFFISDKIKEKKIEEKIEEIPMMDISEEITQKIESLKEEESDIEGLTKYDKLKKGLDPKDYSDTDGDGLTDKDEIEVYHTDPLKISTSGDGIADGYKIKNNLDVNEKYDLSSINYAPYTTFSNIEIKDKSEENSLVYIKEIEGYKVQGVEALKMYSITDYEGIVEIDFSEDLKNINNGYIIVKKGYLDNDYIVLKDKNGIVSVDVGIDGCVVGIIPNLNVDLLDNTTLDFSLDNSALNLNSSFNDSIFLCFPIMWLSGDITFYFFEKEPIGLKSKNRATEIKNLFMPYFEEMNKEDNIDFNLVIQHKYVSAFEYKMYSRICKYFMSSNYVMDILETQGVKSTEEDKKNIETIMAFFVLSTEIRGSEWKTFDINKIDKDAEIIDIVKEKPSKYMTTFDISLDALPFENMGTYISPGGNCAGFSLITMSLFNNSLYKEKGSATLNEKTYSYDISDKEEFKTFFDKYLYDYRSETYWTSTYKDKKISEMSRDEFKEKDAEFLDFLGTKWAEANSQTKKTQGFSWFNFEDDWSKFEIVKSYFENNNKLLYIGVTAPNGGHAIIGYGVEPDSDDPNVWYIYVYDNNFPNNKFGENIVDNRIKIVRKSHWFSEDTYEYDYNPLAAIVKKSSYRFTSYFNKTKIKSGTDAILNIAQVHDLSVYDENFNKLMGGDS